ncbi:MAG: chorismate mutase [Proteobacteria bacterium]|jgi:chorismate mutase|nr:chorismate mutase [Pseudomonadales bacterium]MBL6804782.1 chorismate mutase [Pseudomonadales bacterium]MDA0805984.1 chorismate mutase [Pseudomonadota bacterium]MDA0897345.1 chorismate mutase [Pseudomonadota bacterium]MDA1244272.1 chorismate mutase [Pseudomonadota bacterium]
MGSASVPAELLILRDAIDSIDAELLQVLARRFAKTKRVGELKASMDLEPFDGAREAEKLERLRALADDLGLNASLVDELFSRIMREAVQNHKQLRESRE